MSTEKVGAKLGAVPVPQVMATETAARVTPGRVTFRDVMGNSAGALMRGAESAVRSLPVGPILAASVRPGLGARVGAGPTAMASSAEGVQGAGTSGAAPGTGNVEAALSQSQEMNLYFIEMQERLAAENRAYTAYSNVLKARHDTVKNAIGNIR